MTLWPGQVAVCSEMWVCGAVRNAGAEIKRAVESIAAVLARVLYALCLMVILVSCLYVLYVFTIVLTCQAITLFIYTRVLGVG